MVELKEMSQYPEHITSNNRDYVTDSTNFYQVKCVDFTVYLMKSSLYGLKWSSQKKKTLSVNTAFQHLIIIISYI